ncbi:MAG: hypothetical protein ACRBM6_35305 [Geminicoccales bacterium]
MEPPRRPFFYGGACRPVDVEGWRAAATVRRFIDVAAEHLREIPVFA